MFILYYMNYVNVHTDSVSFTEKKKTGFDIRKTLKEYSKRSLKWLNKAGMWGLKVSKFRLISKALPLDSTGTAQRAPPDPQLQKFIFRCSGKFHSHVCADPRIYHFNSRLLPKS